jgi:hypothetical protein
MRDVPRKTLAAFSAFLLVASVALAADAPWKGKPYQQWDDKDIQRVFTDSPWARKSTITRTWAAVAQKDIPNPQLGGSPNGSRGTSNTQGAPPADTYSNDLTIDVLWASSRVMRAASARREVLHGGKSDLDVDKYAAEPQEEYQIVVRSQDMAPFVRHDEKFFQANSFLEAKKSKQKISASHVQYDRDSNSQMVTAAIFYFPKKTTSGEPTIASDEKNVEFNCKLEGTNLHVNFEPQKMADNQGPAL